MDEKTEIYLNLKEEMYLRIRQQNRCIDQSIYLFSGFAALVVALAGSDRFSTTIMEILSNTNVNAIAQFVVLIFTCIQILVLLNYLYQTWTLVAIDIFLGDAAESSQGLNVGVWENTSWALRKRIGGNFARILSISQPMLIYAILGFGIGCQVYLFMVRLILIKDSPLYYIIASLAAIALCTGSIILLAIIHYQIVKSPYRREERRLMKKEKCG